MRHRLDMGKLLVRAGAGMPVVALVAAALSGCATGPTPPQQGAEAPAPAPAPAQPAPAGKPGGTLRVFFFTGEPPGLDPQKNTSNHTHEVWSLASNRIVKWQRSDNPQDVTPIPDLAERWDLVDPTTYIFSIRPGIKWHNVPPMNGRAFTPQDIKYSIERALDPATANPNRSLFEGIANVDVVGDSAIRIRLKEPLAPFMTSISSEYSWIVPREAVEQHGDLNNFVAGTGPFIFESYQKGVKTTLRKNPDHFEKGLPYVDRVEVLYMASRPLATAALRAGEIDYTRSVPFTDVEALRKTNPQLGIKPYDQGPGNILLTPKRPPYSDLRVRQAINRAIDKKRIGEQAFKGEKVLPAALMPGYLRPLGALTDGEFEKYYGRDVEKARSLLREAGYADGFKIEINTTPPYGPVWNDVAQMVLDDLKPLNITGEVVSVEYGAHFNKWIRQEYDFYLGLSTATGLDPDFFTYGRFHPKGQRNYSGLDDARLTQLVEAQRKEWDAQKRANILHDIEVYHAENGMVIIPLPRERQHFVWQPWLKNAFPHDLWDASFLEAVWLDK